MNRIPAVLIAAAAAFAAGLALVGCEETATDSAESGSFVSRDILADGSIVTVYELFLGDETTSKDFHGLPEIMWPRVLKPLQKSGKAAIFGGDGSDTLVGGADNDTAQLFHQFDCRSQCTAGGHQIVHDQHPLAGLDGVLVHI